jgi:hypothetical protein
LSLESWQIYTAQRTSRLVWWERVFGNSWDPKQDQPHPGAAMSFSPKNR